MVPSEFQDRALFARERDDLTDADIVVELTISEGRAASVRSVALKRIREAVEASYEALVAPDVIEFETVAVLEEAPENRLTAWLRAHLRPASSEVVPSAAFASTRLAFAGRGLLATLEWIEGGSKPRLPYLQQALKVLSAGISDSRSDQERRPNSRELAKAIVAWEDAKDGLRIDDQARIVTRHGNKLLDLAKRVENPAGLLLETKIINPSTDMIFVVEVPDYRCTRQWGLKHGDTRVTVTCEPGTLLDRFYGRELDIRPGDALHCRVEFETAYGPDYEVISERFRIVDVLEVLPAASRQRTTSSAENTAPDSRKDSANRPKSSETTPVAEPVS